MGKMVGLWLIGVPIFVIILLKSLVYWSNILSKKVREIFSIDELKR